jgi:polyisoprenyl-phosphate glycosyltransferase
MSSAPAASATPELSVVAPLYFEEECVEEFVTRVSHVLDEAGLDAEIVLVDDGSTDRTVPLAVALIERYPRLRVVEFSYNHGKALALTAGAQHARGRWVLFMDPDLQDPPEAIVTFLAKAREGYDLVLSTRERRAAGPVDAAFSRLFWWALRRFTGLKMPNELGTMRICSRAFVDRFLTYREANRFLEGLFLHVGLRQTTITAPHHARFAGRTKFNFRRKMSLAVTAICDFSDLPLRLAVRGGLLMTLLGVVAVLVVAALRLFVEFQLGWPSLFCAIVIGVGLNVTILGIVGVYVGKIYREVKGRPLFSVRAVHEASGRS